MKITISEARQRLPELVRQVKADRDLKVQITVHGDISAELRAPAPEPRPGVAAERLRALISEMPEDRGPKRKISENVNEALYGEEPE